MCIVVEAEGDADPNICVYQKSAAVVPDGKDAFYSVATLYDMVTLPAVGEADVVDTMPLMEQVPFYRTNEVTFVCPNQDVADEIWHTFKQRAKRLVREYETSKTLNSEETVSI